jgi:hypothetical protein
MIMAEQNAATVHDEFQDEKEAAREVVRTLERNALDHGPECRDLISALWFPNLRRRNKTEIPLRFIELRPILSFIDSYAFQRELGLALFRLRNRHFWARKLWEELWLLDLELERDLAMREALREELGIWEPSKARIVELDEKAGNSSEEPEGLLGEIQNEHRFSKIDIIGLLRENVSLRGRLCELSNALADVLLTYQRPEPAPSPVQKAPALYSDSDSRDPLGFLEEHYGKYLVFFGAPKNLLFQHHVRKQLDPKLFSALEGQLRRMREKGVSTIKVCDVLPIDPANSGGRGHRRDFSGLSKEELIADEGALTTARSRLQRIKKKLIDDDNTSSGRRFRDKCKARSIL